MLLFFYSAALSVALLASAPFWLYRMATTQKYRHGLAERLGAVPRRVLDALDGRSVIWVHAVSVGEVLAASRLIDELQARAGGHRVLVSTTTRTGQELARKRFGEERVFYFPLDLGWAVQRYLRALRPALLVLLETEFWPNVLVRCARAGVPVAVVNARISDRSYPRYLRLRWLWRRVLRGVCAVLAQSEEDALRLKAIGVPAAVIEVGGNLKYDIRAAQKAPLTAELEKNLASGTKLIVAGSTLEGEERLLLEAWPRLLVRHPSAMLVLAPRHPERFAAVGRLLDASERRWVRRSEWGERPAPLAAGSVLLLDSIGELASVYSLASVAFVGGSLVPAGGHNPLEPAQFGVPVVMGPHYANFRDVAGKLLQAGALSIAEPDQIDAVFDRLLSDRPGALAQGERAREVFAREAGATARAVEALLRLLPEAAR